MFYNKIFCHSERMAPKYLLILALFFTLAACSSQAPSAYEVISEAEIKAGDTVPVPTNETVLTIAGAIQTTNDSDTLQFDMETLEKLQIVEYTVHDPWSDQEVTYTGVLLSDLVNIMNVDNNATTIQVTALDDYQVDIMLADVEKWPVLLANQADGNYMTVESGGPIRIVWPYHIYNKIDHVIYDDLWIWQIVRMEVK